MDGHAEGTEARLRALEDEEDEVDPNPPASWGLKRASSVLQSTFSTTLSESNGFAALGPDYSFAAAFAPKKRRVDPYGSRDQDRAYSFASVVPDDLGPSDWDYYDPAEPDSEVQRKAQRLDGQASVTSVHGDVNDPRNRALEGIFGSTSVRRVTTDEPGTGCENDCEGIHPNIKANFLPINQLHRAQAHKSLFEIRNSHLIASNTGGSIVTNLGGDVHIFTPTPFDKRLDDLDENGKYVGDYKGEIKKRLLRQHRQNVKERARQMERADADYRALMAMSAQERADLLETLRKPYDWVGAFQEDQHDADHIPRVYYEGISPTRVRTWMAEDASAPAAAADPDSTITLSGDDDGGLDLQCTPEALNSLKLSSRNHGQYLQNTLHYGRRWGSRKPASYCSFDANHIQPGSHLDRDLLSNATRSPLTIGSNQLLDELLAFDDSPELQVPEDSSIVSKLKMTVDQEQLNFDATNLSDTYGRVVLVHLHQLVKFSPGAIANRVFGGIIQEIQLFPTQRLAVIIFLHPSEAKAFLRHVKYVHELGLQEDIRALQIEASWYKGREKPYSLLSAQPNILAHHISSNATRCLRLHHLPANKTKETVSAELGARLAMPLLKVILCPPHLDAHRSRRIQDSRLEQDALLGSEARLGRQAVIEFISISDAIRARKLLLDGAIREYEECEPVFAADPSAQPATERAYCKCAGCKYLRRQKDCEVDY